VRGAGRTRHDTPPPPFALTRPTFYHRLMHFVLLGLGALVWYSWSHKDVPFRNPCCPPGGPGTMNLYDPRESVEWDIYVEGPR